MLRTLSVAILSLALAAPLQAKGGGNKGGKGHGHGKGAQQKERVVKHGGQGRAKHVQARARKATPVRVAKSDRGARRTVVTQRVVRRSQPVRTVRHETGGGARVVRFGDRDRSVVRTWYTNTYHGGCPPGLAKKNNGCLPPGHAARRYVVGQPLPTTVTYYVADPWVVTRMTPVPVGYQYVVVDGDVLLLELASRLVVDAVLNLID